MTNETNSPNCKPLEKEENTMNKEPVGNTRTEDGQDRPKRDITMADCRQKMLGNIHGSVTAPDGPKEYLEELHTLAQAEKLEAEATAADSEARKHEAEAARTRAEAARTRAEARCVNAQAAEAEGKRVYGETPSGEYSAQEPPESDEELRHDFHCAAAGYSSDVDVRSVIKAAASQLSTAVDKIGDGKRILSRDIELPRNLLLHLLNAINKQETEESNEQ